ncbi:dihydrofolate reductase family protein [Frondihabitans australicus]|uniref:Dihydrofolate reductase n=1 Tax=Frondihabitans australicus TaxID=386892 RepID=A0A495IGD9_9MICO|nr:dihydrofolate reductase family protein [Frondihabitans australicus]RKR74265.1 dihydrofolate reductase [Frondihabitans australicus]
MGEIVVQEFMTLDGVVQGGGGEDEDREGGFDLGGWQMRFDDGDDDTLIPDWESRVAALLFGRKTYDIWAPFWGTADQSDQGPFGDMIRTYNRVPKFVVSRTQTEGTWAGTEFINDDLGAHVERIKADIDGEIRIWGSTELIESLARLDLVDEYRLMIHPIVLGRGKKLFRDGFPTLTLSLAETWTLPSGMIIAIYRRGHAGA